MHDVIVIGARVAGSATALLLARRGHRVLVLDRASFPSDTLSTHQVQVPAVARLHRWGLLERVVAAGTPATRRVRFDPGPVVLEGRVPECDGVDALYSPRRLLLDGILVDAARESGAEVRERFVVEDLLVEDGRVTGIRGRAKGGAPVTERARLVVGADGKHSLVASTVAAPAYHVRPPLTLACYAYWEGVPVAGGEMAGRADRITWASASAPAAAPSASAPRSTCRTTSSGRTDRAGRWSATPGWSWTRSPARASATRSATPSCWPRRSPMAWVAGGRWSPPSPATSGCGTGRRCRCTG